MKKQILSMILFIAVTGVVVFLLSIGNWLPTVMQRDTMRRYGALEDVIHSLNVRDLYVPAYYPQFIGWPPDLVAAQARPFFALLMHFNRRDSTREALVITQSTSADFARDKSAGFDRITQQVRYQLHGRDALLEVGTCSDGDACSRISWFDGKYHVMIFIHAAPFDAIRSAESMHQYGPPAP